MQLSQLPLLFLCYPSLVQAIGESISEGKFFLRDRLISPTLISPTKDKFVSFRLLNKITEKTVQGHDYRLTYVHIHLIGILQ